MTTNKRNIPFGKPLIGENEKRAVMAILETPTLVHGPKSKEFEKTFAQWTGSPHATTVSSCTAGLHLAYFYKGLGAGDEVIVPAQTHVATAHSVEFTGAKPVFVDAEASTGNIDISQIESKITSKTKAISVVHFLGMPVNMDGVNAIAKKHSLFVVEDCALALGSYFKGVHAGLHGDLGCFSFYPVKHITTSEGGMVITKHQQIAEKIEKQKAFGVDRTPSERKVPGVYDVNMLGMNYRMNEIQSVIGIEQMKRIDNFLKNREQNYQVLERGFNTVEEVALFQSTHGDFKSSYYCFSILLKDKWKNKRFEIVEKLNANGIGTSVYYPQAIPNFTYYREKYGYKRGQYPQAERISECSIALPVGPHLQPDDMRYIVDRFKQIVTEV